MSSESDDDEFVTGMKLVEDYPSSSRSRFASAVSSQQQTWVDANFGGYASSTNSTPVKPDPKPAACASRWDSEVDWNSLPNEAPESKTGSPSRNLPGLLSDDSVVETSASEDDRASLNPVESLKLRIGFRRRHCGSTISCSTGYAEIFSTDDAVRLLLFVDDDDPVSTKVPCNPDDNCLFLVDLRCIETWQDVLSDHLGSWKQHHGGRGYHYRKVASDIKPARSIAVPGEEEAYSFERRLYCSNASKDAAGRKDLTRLVIRPISQNCNFILVQYVFLGQPHSVQMKLHGNSKEKVAPYTRCFDSTKKAIKKSGRKESMTRLNEVVHSLFEYEHPDKMPKGKSQVRMLTTDSQPAENIMSVMEKCKKEAANPVVRFVQEVLPVPSLCVLLASERQLDDLVKFCTNPDNFCVMGVDTTFNVGKFYVSAATYRHLMLKSEKSPVGKHPVMVGAIFVHQEKTTRAYLTFAQMLKKARPELGNVRAFGSDEDKALYQPLRQEFLKALQFLCDLHMRDTVTRKMREVDLSSGEMVEITGDIFGKRCGTGRTAGIVTCKLDEYDLFVDQCLLRWELKSDAGKKFADYFRSHKLEEIRSCLLLESRVSAGLNFDLYNQNANECFNNVLKAKADRKPKTLDEFVEIARSLEMEQTRAIEMAAMGRAEGIALLPEYHHLRVFSTDMYNSAKHPTSSSRQKLGASIHKAKLMPRPQLSVVVEPASPIAVNQDKSIEAVNANIGDAVKNVVARLNHVCKNEKEAMEAKVRQIVTDPTAISRIPGHHEMMVFLVASASQPTQPHKVDASGKGGKITCDCFDYKTCKFCAHSISVALAQELTESFVAHHNRTGKSNKALDDVVGHQLPKSTAKKPAKRTQIRLGKSTPERPVSHIVHPSGIMRLAETSSSVLPSSPAAVREKRKRGAYSVRAPAKKPRLSTEAAHQVKRIAPNPYDCEIHFLADCRSSVRSCSGCSKALHDKKDIPPPPYDLVVVSKLERRYKQSNEIHTTMPGNAYFHARVECVRREIRDFDPAEVKVPDYVKKKLLPIHRRHIANVFTVAV